MVRQGKTRNLSVGGMFIVSPECPPVSTVVRCEVNLPALPGSTEAMAPMNLAAVGRVIRTEGAGGQPGFALRHRVTVLRIPTERQRDRVRS
jgi:hypothetical protein